jgi:ankyrin repeat protein
LFRFIAGEYARNGFSNLAANGGAAADLALHVCTIAEASGDAGMMKLVLDGPFRPPRKGAFVQDSIMSAVRQSRSQVAELLLDYAAPAKLLDFVLGEGLCNAVQMGLYRVVTKLLDLGADPETRGGAETYRARPVEVAAWKGHCDILQLLVSKGADPHGGSSRGGRPTRLPMSMLAAAIEGQVEAARFLLDVGDIQLSTENWAEVYLKAIRFQQHNFLKFLLGHGGAASINDIVDLQIKDAPDDPIALRIATTACHYRDMEVIRVLIKAGMPVSGPMYQSGGLGANTNLMLVAAAMGGESVVQALLDMNLALERVDPLASSLRDDFLSGVFPRTKPPKRRHYMPLRTGDEDGDEEFA